MRGQNRQLIILAQYQVRNSRYNNLNNGIWQTTMLQYGKYLVISGDAQDVSGNTIHLNLFGKLIGSNQDGSVYRITGKIVATETMKVIFSAKVTLIVSNVTSQQTQPKTLPENKISAAPRKAQSLNSDVSAKKILLIAKKTSPISFSYSYDINLKVIMQ